MKRTLVCVVALLVPLSRGVAQQATVASLPIVRPKISVLGTLRDSMLPRDAALSPNGRLVAFTAAAPQSPPTELRILNVRTGEQNVVHTGNVNTFTWGPKGDVISFARVDLEASDKFLWSIRIDSLTGKALEPPRRVGLHRIRYAPFFSPDERLIAYAGATAEDAQATGSPGRFRYSLVVVPANGGTERVLATGIDLRSLSWMANGSALRYRAYVDSTMKAPQRFQVPVTGGTPVRIEERADALPRADGETVWDYTDPVRGETVAALAFPKDVSVSDWSRSNHLVGVREIHPRGLRVVNLADGKARQLLDTTAEVGPPEWFADGQRIATFVRKNGKLSLSVMRADGSESRALALTLPPFSIGFGEAGAHLQVSPDGRYAAFVSEPSDDDETIELMDLSTGKQRTLLRLSADATAPEGKGIGQLIWTGDSKRIRYMSSIWMAEGRSVHEVTLSGADKLLRPLPKSAYPMPVAWFPGTSVAGSQMADANLVALLGGPTMTFVTIDSGATRVVFRNPVIGGGALSPDRRTMAVRAGKLRSGAPTQKVTLIALQDLSTRDINLPFIEMPGLAWHPDGERFFMIGRERANGPANLYSVPTNGAAPKLVASVGSQPEAGAIAVSPKGNFVALTVSATPSATLLRLDFDVQAVVQAGTKK